MDMKLAFNNLLAACKVVAENIGQPVVAERAHICVRVTDSDPVFIDSGSFRVFCGNDVEIVFPDQCTTVERAVKAVRIHNRVFDYEIAKLVKDTFKQKRQAVA
ncbi:MAG: hypothetical protein ACRDDY_12810 [Clostridium sp.]|uniref:hypothetical protein n=1 Tax=Clostridium sp. TaxID=1506 RepID=UPI003EE4DB64